MSTGSRDAVNIVLDRLKQPAKSVPVLSESDIRFHPEVAVWQTERFISRPWFYPVYRYQDFYSYSLLALILLCAPLQG